MSKALGRWVSKCAVNLIKACMGVTERHGFPGHDCWLACPQVPLMSQCDMGKTLDVLSPVPAL